jgi:hypothetical protein
MTKKQNLLLVIVVAWLLAISACTVVSVGFTVKTQDRVNTPSGRINVDASLREVGGRFLSDIGVQVSEVEQVSSALPDLMRGFTLTTGGSRQTGV